MGDTCGPIILRTVHKRIFETILKFADRGLIANPVTLKHHFDRDEAWLISAAGNIWRRWPVRPLRHQRRRITAR